MHFPTSVAALPLLAFFALLPPGARADDIVVGQVADQSGFYADATRDFLAGARTYFDSVNASGGVHGRRIVLRVADDGGDPARSVELTRAMLDKEKAVVLFGYAGDANVRAVVRSEAYVHSGIALVGAVSGLDLGADGANVFFTRASYEAELRRAMDLFNGMGIRRFALAVAPLESTRAVAEKAGEFIRAAGGEQTATREIPIDGREPREAARDVRATNPQVVFVLADSLASAAFIKAYRQIDVATFLVALSVVNHATVTELIGAKFATGTLITQVMPDPFRAGMPIIGEHLRLMKKFRDEPPSHLTLEGFIAAKTLVAALRKGPRDARRQEIAAAMRSLQFADLGGVTVDFSAGRSRGYGFVDIAFLRRNGTLLR
jgi:branched-chain amino acid transport system substrate-binding protein